MKKLTAIFSVTLLAGCASYDGRSLVVGVSTTEEVTQVMGRPAMQWTEADGARQFAYPRGPEGVRTYMVRIDANGKLRSINNVMDLNSFAAVRGGMSVDEVIKILGPSRSDWTAYFERRDELVLGWRYCDDWNKLARFFVLFDATRRTVRSTMSQQEALAPEVRGDGSLMCAK